MASFSPELGYRHQPPLEQEERCPAERWIKEGKNAVKWTRLSCHDFIRLQLFVLAYNLGNFFRHTALPKPVRHWTMTTLREKLIKIGAKVVCHARYITFSDGAGHSVAGFVRGYPWKDTAAPTPC